MAPRKNNNAEERPDYVKPGSDEHRALLGLTENLGANRKAELEEALVQPTLVWVGRVNKTPIGDNTPPGMLLVEGFVRRRP